LKFETSAERRDVANKTLPNQRTIVGNYKSRRRNTSASYSSSVHHMIRVQTKLFTNNRLHRRQKLKSHIPKLIRHREKLSDSLNCRRRSRIWPHSVASIVANARERGLRLLCEPLKQCFQVPFTCLLSFQPIAQPSHYRRYARPGSYLGAAIVQSGCQEPSLGRL
jgi:hypothetical protein